MKRIRSMALAAALPLCMAGLASRAFAVDDPFALTPTLTSHAVFSCSDLVVNGGARTSSAIAAHQGHVLTNGKITVNGNAVVDGNATAGPGKTITVTGGGQVSGTKSNAPAAAPCSPIDLTALAATLATTNDNSRIPKTDKNKDPLSGSSRTDFTLNGNDGITLPAGTYYFTKVTLNGNSTIRTSGLVRILSTGAVTLNGQANTAAGTSPFNLRLFTSGTALTLNGGSAFSGFVYAPSASVALNGNITLTGGLFAQQVTLNGGASVVRRLDASAPVLVLTEPVEGVPVPDLAAVSVNGTATDPDSPVTVTVNGVPVVLSADGSFATTVDAHAMPIPTITVVATDAVGNATTRVVVLCPPDPTIALDPLPAVVAGRLVDVSGIAADANGVTVNGVPAVLANGRFTLTAFDLGGEGDHTLTVVATGRCKTATATAVVSVDTTNPVVAIDTPADQSVLGITPITVGGTVSDAHLTGVTVNGLPASLPGGGRFSAEGITLVEGANTLTAIATDVLGHTSSHSAVVYLDTVAPSVVITSPKEGDVLTTPTTAVEGDVHSANLVTVTVCGQSAQITGSHFTLAACALVEGDNTVIAMAKDRANLTTDSQPVHVSLDTRAPALTVDPVTSPTSLEKVTVKGTVVEPHLDTLTVNGVEATVTDGAFTAPDVPLFEGTNAVLVHASDTVGHATDSEPLHVERDTQPPVVAITTPQPGACVPATEPVSLSGTYADAHPATEGTGAVQLQVRTSNGATASVDATLDSAHGTWTATIAPGSADGTAVITLTAKDALEQTAHALASLRVDAQIPVVTLLLDGAPFPGAASGAEPAPGEVPVTLGRAVSPRVLVSDGFESAPPSAVLTLNGVPYAEGTPIDTDTPGPHLLVARATDCAGHEGATHASFTIDVAAPRLLSTVPVAGALLGVPVAAFSGTSDADLVSARVNGLPAQITPPGGFGLTPFPWREGLNTVLLDLTDAAGNSARYTVSFTVKTLAPSLEILESGLPIGSGALFLRPIAPTLRSNDPTATITATLNGAPFTSGTAISSTGDYTLWAKATDVAAHETVASVAFRVDLGAAPTISISSPAEDAVLPEAKVTVTGTTGASTQSVSVNGRVAAFDKSAGIFTAADLPLERDMPNELVAVAVDAAGRTASATRSVTVKSSGPRLLILSPAEGTRTNRRKIDVSGALLGGASQTATGAVALGARTAPVDATGAFRFVDVDLVEGNNELTVTGTDAQNRTGSAAVRVVADLTGPAIALKALGAAVTVTEGATLPVPVTLQLAVTDGSGPAPIPTVRLNGRDLLAAAPTLDIPITEAGGYVVSAVARDAAGNETRLERSFIAGSGGCALTQIDPPDGFSTSSATVTLHGRSGAAASVLVRVPNPGTTPTTYQEFVALLADGTFAAADVPLPATGENALELVCTDATGLQGTTINRIFRLAGAGPAVHITSPAAGLRVKDPTVAVSGTVSDPTARVFVNGQEATVATVTPPASGDATFTLAAAPLSEGPNVLSARAVDRSGRSGEDRTTISRDSTAPRLQITSPPASSTVAPTTGTAAVDVVGTVDLSTEPIDSSAPSVPSVNVATPAGSVTATVDALTGAFLASAVPMAPGTQTITATATDLLGQAGTATVQVTFDATGPAIRLEAPTEGARVTGIATSIPVSGEAWGAEGAQISVNGGGIDPTTLTWETVAGQTRRHVRFAANLAPPTQDGSAAAIARVEEVGGKAATDRRLFVRDGTAPEVIELIPANDTREVDPNTLAMALFSESVTSLGGATGLTLTRLSTGEIIVGTHYALGGAVAFVPGAALARGEQYKLTAGTGITDIAGHPLAQSKEAIFTVALSPTATAPVLDPVPPVICQTVLALKGNATPMAAIRVRDEELTFTGTADATGRFAINVPLSRQGYHGLHVVALSRDGLTTSPEAHVLFRVDCTVPRVTNATFDRATGKVTIVFSEGMSAATLTTDGATPAIEVTDAEDAARTPKPVTLALSTDATIATLDLGAASDAWWREKAVRLDVGPPAADIEGNEAARYETVFYVGGDGDLSGSFLSGEAYDDATGRPLEGTSVQLFASGAVLPGAASVASAPFRTATTDGRGRYHFAGEVAAGRYAVVLSRGGATRVIRRLPLEPSIGAVPFDGRLMPLSEASVTKLTTASGTIEGPQGSGISLSADANALPSVSGDLDVQLTPLSGQGLPELLPLGYTPLAAVHLRLSTTPTQTAPSEELPEGSATPFASGSVRLTVPLPLGTPIGAPLIAVRHDVVSGTWLTLAPPERFAGLAGAPDTVRVTLVGPGAVAVVLADTAEAIKPPALAEGAGNPLLGAAFPQSLPTLTGAITLDPPVVGPTGRSTARVVGRSSDGTTAWPSGLAVSALLDEKLVLADGGELYEAPFTADLVLYHLPLTSEEQGTAAREAAGAMFFKVSPSPRAAQVLFRAGYDNIRLYPFPDQLERGSVLGPAGGSVTSPDGTELILAEGALSQRTIVKATRLSDTELAALPAIEGWDTVAAIRVDLAGQVLARPAMLKVPVPQGLEPDANGDIRFALATFVEQPADGRASFARVIARANRSGDAGSVEKLVASPEPDATALPLEGLIREGVYLFLHAKAPIAWSWGLVTAENGYGLTSARVTAATLGTADLTVPGGAYATAIPAPNATLTAIHPSRDERGTAGSTNVAISAIIRADITIHPVAPTITGVQPLENAANQPVGSTVVVRFSEPLDPTTVTSSTLIAELALADGTGTGATFLGTVALSADGTAITFTPSRPLPPSRKVLCRFIGGVRDAGGTPYAGGGKTWLFTTSDVFVPGGQVHPEKFHLELPVDGRSRIIADAGAMPSVVGGSSPWSVWAEIEGPAADPVKDTLPAATDGSIVYMLGHPPSFAVTIASKVWVHVLDPAGTEAAAFRLGPFVTPDRLGFVAAPGEKVVFTSAEGVEVTSPEGAFDTATLVRVSKLDPATLGVTPNPGFAVATYVDIDFDGTAKESLRVRIPVTTDAPVGSLAFAGEPIDLPWGKKLRILDIGSVIDGGNGTKLISNHEEHQPTDAPLTSGRLVAPLGGTGPSRMMKQALLELSSRSHAAWLVGSGAELSVGGGTVPYEIMQQFSVLWNFFADAMVYVPTPVNWTGQYLLPLIAGQPFTLVAQDGATGWTIFRQEFGSISGPVGSVIAVPPVEDDDPTPAVLADAYPFSVTRFKAEKAGDEGKTCLSVRLELQACSLTGDLVKIEKQAGYPLADETRLALLNVTSEKTSETVRVLAGTYDDRKLTLPGKSGEEMLLLVSPGELDPADAPELRLSWDRALEPLGDPTAAVKLVDCGEPIRGCSLNASPFPIKLDNGGELTENRFTQLRILLQGQLPRGHLFRLTLAPDQFRRKVKGHDPVPARGPTEFLFVTRKEAQAPLAASDQTLAGLLARDLVKLGNLLIVSTANGQLLALDVSTSHPNAAEPNAPIPFKPYARLGTDTFDEIRALKSDGHGRIFLNGRVGGTWAIKAVRLEDIRNATPGECKQPADGIPVWAQGVPCFPLLEGGVKAAFAPMGSMLASDYVTSVGSMATGLPTDMDVVVEDFSEEPREMRAFYEAHPVEEPQSFDSLTWDARGFASFKIRLKTTGYLASRDTGFLCPGEPQHDRYQRVTVENLTTGQSWSFDVENAWPGVSNQNPGTLDVKDIRARRGDKLRVKVNIRTLGYTAIVGSGVSVFDLNRFYRLPAPQIGGLNNLGECGRRLGKYEGVDQDLGSCWSTDPVGIANTTAVAVLGATLTPDAPSTGLDVYTPLSHVGGIHASARAVKPGDLAAGQAVCFRLAAGDPIPGDAALPAPWLRSVALGRNMKWLDKGIVGDLAGHFTLPWEQKEWRTKTSDLVFYSLGAVGVWAFKVTDRQLTTPIGRFYKKDHWVYRVQVDERSGRLFAGGNTPEGEPFIDVWDIERVNGGPTLLGQDPRLLASIKAPWDSTHIGFDEAGSGLLYTWGSMPGQPPKGYVLPIADPEFVFAGLFGPTKDEPVPPGQTAKPPYPEERTTAAFVPLGVAMRYKAVDEADAEKRKKDERLATAAFRVRVALPGDFGDTLVAKVQSLRGLPEKERLRKDDVGAFVAMPGGPGWPENEVFVTLKRLGQVNPLEGSQPLPAGVTHDEFKGEGGRLSLSYNLYESKEVVLLLADPRARDEYWKTRQKLEGEETADEESQCRRCERPEYLQRLIDEGRLLATDIKELLAGGPYVRAVLSVTKTDTGNDKITIPPDDGRTTKALAFFDGQSDYRAPSGTAQITTWADEVLSPIQASLKEPILNPAIWDSGERGVSVLLGGGEATFSVTDYFKPSRGIDVSFERSYRSGVLGYGPLGSAGWGSSLHARLRRIPLYGEADWDSDKEAPALSELKDIPDSLEFHDGSGRAFRLIGKTKHGLGGLAGKFSCPSGLGVEGDSLDGYCVPKGLYLRVQKLATGFRILGQKQETLVFSEAGRLLEIRDRHRQNETDPKAQGNTHGLTYDVFGALSQLEDGYGRTYRFTYFDKPKENGEQYGLLKSLTDFAKRETKYAWRQGGENGSRGDRTLLAVTLPSVTSTLEGSYSHTDPSYRYSYGVAQALESGAPHHGADFGKLRLKGMKLPGVAESGKDRVAFSYESNTGRVNKLTLPGSPDIDWKVEQVTGDGETPTAAPAKAVKIVAPFSHYLTHAIKEGRDNLVFHTAPTLKRDAATPEADGTAPDLLLETKYEYEGDGRLKTRTETLDGLVTTFEYPDSGFTGGLFGSDRLENANLARQSLEGTNGTVNVNRKSVFSYESGTNVLEGVTDPEEQHAKLPVAAAEKTAIGRYEAEGVTHTTDFDAHGRPKKWEGLADDKSPKPTETRDFWDDESGRTGKGYLKSISKGNEVVEEYARYDKAGNLETKKVYKIVTTTRYDEWDRPVSIEPGGSEGKYKAVAAKIERGYDAAGHLVLETEKQGDLTIRTTWLYNEREQLDSVTRSHRSSPEGTLVDARTSFGYDEHGRLKTVTSPAGVVTTYAYDAAGRIASETTGSGLKRRLYDEGERLTFTTDGHEGIWRAKHNAFGEIYEEKLPTGSTLTRAYNLAGKVKSEKLTDATGKLLSHTEYKWTSWGAPRVMTEHLVKGEAGNPDEVRVTTNSYDKNGRLQAVWVGPTESLGGSARLVLAHEYDEESRVIKRFDAAVNIEKIRYGEGSLWPASVVFVDGATDKTLETFFDLRDALGNVLFQHRSDGMTMLAEYDQRGNLLSRVTGAGSRFIFEWDGEGKLTSMTSPSLGRLTLSYDLDGRIRKRSVFGEASPWITEYRYDTAHSGRPLSVLYPDGTSETYDGYDPDDILRTWKTRYGHVVTNQVDAANRLLSMTPSGGPASVKSYPMAFAYDGASRLTKAEKTGIAKADVAISGYDLGGRPTSTDLGTGANIESLFNTWDDPEEVRALSVIAGEGLPIFQRQFDAMSRPTRSALSDNAGVVPPAVKIGWQGIASLGRVATETGGPFSVDHQYVSPGRLDKIAHGPEAKSWGSLLFGYRGGDGYKESRTANSPSAPRKNAGVLSNQGWGYTPDDALRLKGAKAGEAGAFERFAYDYFRRDELRLASQEKNTAKAELTPDVDGRIKTRNAFVYAHDAAGNRTEDERFLYTWTWRGELASLRVKKSWPSPRAGKPDVTPLYPDHKLFFEYDALGRLVSRRHMGALPENETDDAVRPFIQERAYLWDGGTLLAESGKEQNGATVWRKTFVPGPTGQDDPVQMRVENLGAGPMTTGIYAFLRDEQSTVLGLIDQQAPGTQRAPPVPARYLYTPLGEAHVELGPELLRADFDKALRTLNATAQAPPRENETVPGGLTFVTTISFDPETLGDGVSVESCDGNYGECAPVSPGTFAIAELEEDATKLSLLPIDGWPKASHFRIRLRTTLKDDMGRPFMPPEGGQHFEVRIDVPNDGVTSPVYGRVFDFVYDTVLAASSTVGDRVPGGMNLLFGGSWTDPVAGLQYKGFAWYDPRSGEYLSARSDGTSLSEYAHLGFAPNLGTTATPYVAPDEATYVAPVGPWPAEPKMTLLQFGTMAAQTGAYFVPWLGEALMAKDAVESYRERRDAGQGVLDSAFGSALDQVGVSALYAEMTGDDIVTGEESELLCVAEDALVLTPRGHVPAGEIRVGQRVTTPQAVVETAESCAETDIDPAAWRLVKLEVPRAFPHVNETIALELLRSAEQVEEEGLTEGAVVPFELEGMAAPAKVVAIEPAPAIETGPGRLVLMKSVRRVTEILELKLEGEDEPLRVTADHPLLTESRGWVEAGALLSSERLVTDQGLVALESIASREGPVGVVNYIVDADHVYFVSARDGRTAVLVHNGIRSAAKRAAKRIWGAERRAHWRRVGLAELESASGRYSAQNVQRMLAGRAPRVKIRARIRKTGATRDLSVSMDLSHELLPQRVIGRWIPEVAQPYLHRRPNIKMRAPWEHALVDRYRKTGYDFIGTLEDLSVYSGK
jgi:YD repeat-containing protein